MRDEAWMAVRRLALVALVAMGLFGCSSGEFNGIADGGRLDAAGDADGALTFADGKKPALDLTIEPRNKVITVEAGKPAPTVQYVAKIDGKSVMARWSFDVAELGSLSAAGLFTPSGKVGGQGKVTALVGKREVSARLTVALKFIQNGATTQNGNPGPGGFGGVGGEGLGPAAGATVVAVLKKTPTANAALKMLYPYHQTVWPLGILAPLLQWSALPKGKGDGVLIELKADHFEFLGTFGRPAALGGGMLLRHPIPQDVWAAATRTAAGKTLSLRIVVASAGVAYGPLTQTWKVASGALKGTVYYQSYGTKLAKNFGGAKGGDGRFGGATLAIKGGSTDPVLVAGKSGGHGQCRVCHSVAARGSRMLVQHGDRYSRSSGYDLLNGYKEQVYSASDGKLGWIGMTPDGKLGLGNAAPIPGRANSADSALYDMNTGTVVTSTGLTTFVKRAGFPMFSPDSKRVAFTFYAGAGSKTIGGGDPKKLVMMDFDRKTLAFSKPRLLHRSAYRVGWPAFWPTSNALAFQIERAVNRNNEYFATRDGAKGELWWVDVATGKATALGILNGKNAAGALYLPKGAANHGDDSQLNYEPTISPIASGGYAWIVFVSRRLYGNVATIDPWASDPRAHDLTKTPTTKKLWIAALDLNPKPGRDPSHPAFYLPAQELLAGNSRGFWVADPCKPDGRSCQGGDECCNGFCSMNAAGAMVCGKHKPACAKEFDRCQVDTDCCNAPKHKCINEHCARWGIN